MDARLAEIDALLQDPTLPHSDQELLIQELDELLNAQEEPEWEDDREGCERCSGCAYCMSSDEYGEDEV